MADGPAIDGEARLYADLEALGIGFVVEEHAAVFTVEESHALHERLMGVHSKNLFLKDAGGQFWLVTVPADIRVDLKALPAAMGSKRLSFGKADDLLRLTRLTPGSVTPLGAIADHDGALAIVLDRRVADGDPVWVHPLRNTASIGLSGAGLVAALRHWSHDPAVIDVPAMSEP